MILIYSHRMNDSYADRGHEEDENDVREKVSGNEWGIAPCSLIPSRQLRR
jgi:hypothetical protein